MNAVIKKLVILFLAPIALSCTNNDDPSANECDFQTLISGGLYVNAPSDELVINSLDISNDCLRINFSASGCSGDTWEIQLIDSEAILESLPPQRNLRLSLKNEEDCEAFITKEYTFDISNLQVQNNQVYLNIVNADESILYSY